MKEFSKETIEINGVEYTLFLNRKGLVSWENITKVSQRAEELRKKYKNTIANIKGDKPINVEDNANPFDYADDNVNDLEEDREIMKDIYIKFYWIALYENHKLPVSEVTKLFEQAEKEYGFEQLTELANQMITDANSDNYGNTELKKLTALHQTKQIITKNQNKVNLQAIQTFILMSYFQVL